MKENLSETKSFIIRKLEEEYNYKKMIFIIENPEKNIKDFIENELAIIQKLEKEYDRKCNLSDNDVYEEIKKEKKYLSAYKNATDKEIEEFLKHSLKEHRDQYIRNVNEGIRSIFYNTKLNNVLKTEQKFNSKDNRSSLLNGKKLNLSERYKIANKVLDIDRVIRKLKIKELEKYQLLAYILGCDKDNARDIMNGTYNSKDRDLDDFFNEIGLNK